MWGGEGQEWPESLIATHGPNRAFKNSPTMDEHHSRVKRTLEEKKARSLCACYMSRSFFALAFFFFNVLTFQKSPLENP